jgi:hypothetical protein
MSQTLDFTISMLSQLAATKGKALKKRDSNNTGRDDLFGQALLTLSALGEAYVDDELAMNEALAVSLEDLAAMIRNPANAK